MDIERYSLDFLHFAFKISILNIHINNNLIMNKDKKIQIGKTTARRLLLQLKRNNCFDGFISRYYTRSRCINYLQECIEKYFKTNKQLITWNKDSYFDLFEDKYLVDSIVWYMQDFNLDEELDEYQKTKK